MAASQEVDNRMFDEIWQRYNSFLRDNPDGVLEVNLQGEIICSNPALEQILGVTAGELQGLPFRDFVMVDRGACIESLLQCEQVISGEIVLRHKDGQPVPARSKSLPIVVSGQSIGAHIILTDLTTDKQAIEELETANLELQTIFDTIAVSLWITEPPFFPLRKVSPQTEKIWGVPLEQLMSTQSAWYEVIHPDDVELVRKTMQGIEHGRECVHDYRIIHPDGQVRWIHDRVHPVVGEDGTVVRVIGVAIDITPLKLVEAEREQARRMLERSDKLSALGQLAAGIAHEIRNPLTSLMGFIQLIRPQLPDQREYFDIMGSELNRIEAIVQEFLLLSKPMHIAHQRQPHDLSQLIDTTVSFVQAQTTMQNIAIVTEYDPTVPRICLNEAQFKQVIMNLLRNSMEAMTSGGEIQIQLKIRGDRQVVVRIIDFGNGIPPELLSKIGEPFFTTKDGGTGLGMAVTQQIIESHGGEMVVESEVGKGTIVSVILPRKTRCEGDPV